MRMKTAFAPRAAKMAGLENFDPNDLPNRHGHKELVGLRIDEDVIAFFRSAGAGYQTRINAVLRHVMQATLGTPQDA